MGCYTDELRYARQTLETFYCRTGKLNMMIEVEKRDQMKGSPGLIEKRKSYCRKS